MSQLDEVSGTSLKMGEGLLTVKDVAGLCQVSEKTIRREIDGGNLVATRIGRQLRIAPRNYEAWVLGGVFVSERSAPEHLRRSRRVSSKSKAQPFLYDLVDVHRLKRHR